MTASWAAMVFSSRGEVGSFIQRGDVEDGNSPLDHSAFSSLMTLAGAEMRSLPVPANGWSKRLPVSASKKCSRSGAMVSADRVADLDLRRQRRRQLLAVDGAVNEALGAEFLDVVDLQRQRLFAGGRDPQVFGADADGDGAGKGRSAAEIEHLRTEMQLLSSRVPRRRFMAGEPMKLATKVEAGVW